MYAFTKVGDRSGTVDRVVARRVVDTQWFPGGVTGKVQIVASGADFGGSGCGFHDGNLHPFSRYAPGASPSGPATDPYDRSKALSTTKGCGSVSRT